MKFRILHGLGGGFGGGDYEVVECKSQEEADSYAYEAACDDYESYAGMHGLRDTNQIMEDEDIDDEDEAWEIYREERESWIVYDAEPYVKGMEID